MGWYNTDGIIQTLTVLKRVSQLNQERLMLQGHTGNEVHIRVRKNAL